MVPPKYDIFFWGGGGGFGTLSLIEGILKQYPDIGGRLKRFYRTPKKVLSNPLGGPKGTIEPLGEGLQNHRQGSIVPCTSNFPFLGYSLKILGLPLKQKIAVKNVWVQESEIGEECRQFWT